MWIKRIYIRKFRNIEEQVLEFSPEYNIFRGGNGQGKTNLLEAVYFSGYARSFRTRTLQHLKADFDKADTLSTGVIIDDNNVEKNYRIELKGKKKIWADDIETDFSELLEENLFITFIPDDIRIVKNDPVYRRRFLNELCSQYFPGYFDELIRFRKILNARNRLLKDRRPFHIWDDMFVESGNRIISSRIQMMERLKEIFPKIWKDVSMEKEDVSLEYKGDRFLDNKVLMEQRAADISRGYTTVGPHRADLEIRLNGHDVRKSASRGQLKTIIFSLKMTQGNICGEIKKTKPVIILDDVFSELDSVRQKKYLDYMGHSHQIFISTTDDELCLPGNNNKLFFIREGKTDEGKVFKTG
ncbi:MAG: DNA replication/repair protein RecF [Candidatus Muiribacteriaceae bacterium]